MIGNNKDIKTWKQFAKKVRSQGCTLLKHLNEFENPILIAGCQRSGTTMLSRIITSTKGMAHFQENKDDELDAALILSGNMDSSLPGRYCFQTTYLNECYSEYFEYQNKMKLVWIVRNPFSVVYSFLYNWKRFALNELFLSCGTHFMDDLYQRHVNRFGVLMIKRILRACYAYNGKSSQIIEIKKKLPIEQVMVVEYNSLVENKLEVLPAIYDFLDLKYEKEYCNQIRSASLKKATRLKKSEYKTIDTICIPVYERALKELSSY